MGVAEIGLNSKRKATNKRNNNNNNNSNHNKVVEMNEQQGPVGILRTCNNYKSTQQSVSIEDIHITIGSD